MKIINQIKSMWCKIRGHDARKIWYWRKPIMVCVRCNEYINQRKVTE